MLSQKEQIQIIREFKSNGKKDILEPVIRQNMKIIRKVAESFLLKNKTLNLDDLKASGIEGLMLAVYKFDESKNDAFLPYAKLWIKVKMQEYVKDFCSIVTISGRNGRKLFSNYFRYANELEFNGIPSTIDNVAKKSKISENEIGDFVNALAQTASLFHSYDNNEEERFASTSSLNIEKEYERNQAYNYFNSEISNFNQKLSQQEKIIWNNRFLNSEPEKLSELSEKIGLTPKKVSLIEKKIMQKFKRQILSSPMKELYHTIIE